MIISYLLRPKPKIKNADAPNLTEYTYPTNDSSRVVGEIFGTVLVSGTQYIYGGQVRVDAIVQQVGGKKGGK